MPDEQGQSHDAVTTPVGVTTMCPHCGVVLDALTTTCGACGAVITAGGPDGAHAERVRSKLQGAIGDAFTLGDMLGRGGMGIVFRAREKALDRDVALKVLAFDPVLNPEAYQRFEREAKLAAKLDHPNIVPIFAVGQRNGIAFYTMRMVGGGSVEQLVRPGQGLDVPHALNILRDVASALDYAHAHGVVHRDIKPANILVGDSGHALVADFGIARAFGGDAPGATATGTGIVGSPAYMSPEQWRGEKVDGRADQYALGVLAFELLSGRRPFADASMQELLRMHLAEDPPDIISFRQDLPSGSTDAIWRAMAKHPGDRFSTAMEFVGTLAGEANPSRPVPRVAASTAGAGGVATSVKRVTPVPPPKPASHRSAWLIAALLVALGALGAAVVFGRPKTGPERTAAVSPAAPALNAAVATDSLASLEEAQSAENARLQKELDDARRIALEAERKVEQMAAAQAGAGRAGTAAPVAEAPHAHLLVLVRGGTPRVFVDGVQKADKTPAAIELAPGQHSVSVKGGQEFLPAQFSVELAPDDTQQVVFLSKSVAESGRNRKALGNQPPRAGSAAASPPDTLAPVQRRQYQRFKQRMDSVRKASRPPS